jgi:hypothetical protein
MTIHFAAAQTREASALARMLCAKVMLNAANDNSGGLGGDQILRAALRHFAEHGLSAAERARDLAEEAFFAGDREQYRRWMAICTALDRRMAPAVAFRQGR